MLIHEEVFNEMVERAKVGDTSKLPSCDRAMVWAHEEIARLRAGVQAMTEIVPPIYPGWSESQVLAKGPTQMINHCNALLESKEL